VRAGATLAGKDQETLHGELRRVGASEDTKEVLNLEQDVVAVLGIAKSLCYLSKMRST